MPARVTAETVVPQAFQPARRSWLDRVCARLGGWCELLRAAHHARVPY